MEYVVDTNVLLGDIEKLNGAESFVITSHVLRELENHKRNKNAELAFQARKATRFIEEYSDKFTFDLNDYSGDIGSAHDTDYVDNKLIDCCRTNQYGLMTKDLLLKFKARAFSIPLLPIDDDSNEQEYSGVKDVLVDTKSNDGQSLLAAVYESPDKNIFKLERNEYVVLWNCSKPLFSEEDGSLLGYECIDKFRWNGERMVKPKAKPVSGRFLGKIKPINVKQELLFDMMQNSAITVKTCFGKYGVGKDFVMIAHAIERLEADPNIHKIIWVRNNVELRDTKPIGFLPGDKDDKLIEFAMPLADHLGGLDGLRLFMDRGKIEIQHIGTLRGRDIKNAIIYVTEVQNNTSEHVKLLLGRVGEHSELWLNGDIKQVDSDVFLTNSGIRALTKLKGNGLYGQVTLDKTERSETASLADLI